MRTTGIKLQTICSYPDDGCAHVRRSEATTAALTRLSMHVEVWGCSLAHCDTQKIMASLQYSNIVSITVTCCTTVVRSGWQVCRVWCTFIPSPCHAAQFDAGRHQRLVIYRNVCIWVCRSSKDHNSRNADAPANPGDTVSFWLLLPKTVMLATWPTCRSARVFLLILQMCVYEMHRLVLTR
jgi:hypothetical protein